MKRDISLILGAVFMALIMTGCMTAKTRTAQLNQAETMQSNCIQNAIPMIQAQNVTAPIFSDARDHAIYVMAQALSGQTLTADRVINACNQVAMQSIQSDAEVRRAVIGLTGSAVGWVAGAYAVVGVSDAFKDLGKAKGNSSITNSRVLDAGGGSISNSSASGDNLFLGNSTAVDGSLAQGGIQPRQAIVNDSDNITSPSQSGENQPANPDIGDEDAVIQPVAEP